MSFRYISNWKSHKAIKCDDITKLNFVVPKFKNKKEYADWCGDEDTQHAFYTLCVGDNPNLRIAGENEVFEVNGMVLDYDASLNWETVDEVIKLAMGKAMPTWRSETFSGYIRLVWIFEEPVRVHVKIYKEFILRLATKVNAMSAFAGLDEGASFDCTRTFALGTNWVKLGEPLKDDYVLSTLYQTVKESPPELESISIPLDIVYDELQKKYGNKIPCSKEEFKIGYRSPLFWIEPFKDSIGCQVIEGGIWCYSNRATSVVATWKDLLGANFVKEYEEKKLKKILDRYWYNGSYYFKLDEDGRANKIPQTQLILELRILGFCKSTRKQPVSELDLAIDTVNNQNRIDAIAPVIFSSERIVRYDGKRILNERYLEMIQPAESGDPKHWPFLYDLYSNLFAEDPKVNQMEVFFSWLHRARLAVESGDLKKLRQGQAMIWCGGAGVGKSLSSGGVVAPILGGSAQASRYLSGKTSFNKELAHFPLWTIDDNASAACFTDQRRTEELIKATVANRVIEYHAKFAEAIKIPMAPRVFITVNHDPASLSSIPSLDQSNRDKIIALRICENASDEFPEDLDEILERELPHLTRYIIDWEIPSYLKGTSRFGVISHIDAVIARAAYDNSRRSHVAELVEEFVQGHREDDGGDDKYWSGTLTTFQKLLTLWLGGNRIGVSGDLHAIRQGLQTMEAQSKIDDTVRPVRSSSRGGGTIWEISLDNKYDYNQESARV